METYLVLSLRRLLLLKRMLSLKTCLLLLKMLRQVHWPSHSRSSSSHRLKLRLCHLVHSIWHANGHAAVMLG